MRPISTILGDAYFRRGRKPFGMHVTDRLQHLYLVGQTGVGKSTLLGQLARQDAASGQGLCLLDPHGDLASELAASVPNCLYWNPADPECRFGYNPLTTVSAQHRPLVVSGLIETLKKQWADAWGPRMEHLLRYALLALLEQPRTDLRDVLPLFIDTEFQRKRCERPT
ncbi:MAG: type IV secretion system DNA-binding domain-containing protein [Alphaproteobacteria bacterium]|nr:type IV secretion system DNA-binding domain-containing protein [Alphaproteobacteria bacterium]MCB9929063.1 type IV secretion system DNA-binding domain-containing protein [Alphaproteobacteria bacterium]